MSSSTYSSFLTAVLPTIFQAAVDAAQILLTNTTVIYSALIIATAYGIWRVFKHYTGAARPH